MANQEVQKPAAPELAEAELNQEVTDAEAQGRAELEQRFEAVINKMAAIYRVRLEKNIMTREALTSLSVSADTPDWKRKAAQRALGVESNKM